MDARGGSCPGCGAVAAPDARFCSQCGAALAVGPEARKLVTAVFADIVGSTRLGELLDPEDFRELIGAAVARIVRAVEELGGSVKQLAGDGVLAIFGAPVSHEDDAERAVLAGLKIVEELAREPAATGGHALEVRVGVETGVAVIGAIGGGRKIEYGAMGDPLNTAARLEAQATPGSVLVGARTHRLVEPLFEWGEPRAYELKGKSDAVVAYQVRGARIGGRPAPAAPATAPLVGRDSELGLARERVDAVLGGAGGTVVISGEAGVGKTRLLSEVRGLFESSEPGHGTALWLEGRCVSYGDSLPYWPIRALIRSWLGGRGGGMDVVPDRLAKLLAPNADDLLPWLVSLIGADRAPEAAAGLPAELIQRRVHGAFAALLERVAADGPVAVALEDLHWADESSALLVEHLLPLTERAAVLLVLTGRLERDRPLARVASTAVHELPHRCVELRLGALDDAAQCALLRELLGTASLPAPIEAEILARAEGNPLYLEQLVRALVDAGALVQDGGEWRFDPGVPVEIPETVEKIILARVDRLDPRCHEVLGAAAVVGRQFRLSLLERLADDVAGPIEELQRLELVREVRRWPEPEFRFKHALIREAVYGTLLRPRREQLHRAAAEALAALPAADRLPDEGALLARHWAAAGDHEKALDCYIRAAEHADAISAIAEAGAHWEAAQAAADELGLDERDARVRQVLLGWASRLRAGGSLSEGRAALERALAGARAAGDRRDEMRVLLELALSLRVSGEWDRVIGAVERALAIAEDLDDAVAQTDALRRLAITHSNLLQLDVALDVAARARRIAEATGSDSCLAAAHDAMKLPALYAGDLSALDDAGASLTAIYRRSGNLHDLAWALAEWAYVPIATGRFAEAERRIDEALELTDRTGDRLSVPVFLASRCWLERSAGRYGAALASGREALTQAEAIEFAEWAAWAAGSLGLALLELNASAFAAPVLERGIALGEASGALAQHIQCVALSAEAARLAGDIELAVRRADAAEELLARVAVPPGGAWLWGGHAAVAVARTRLEQGDLDRVRALAMPLLDAARGAGWHEMSGLAALVLGRAAATEAGGDAEPLLRTALAEAEAGSLPGLEWRARAALAEMLVRRGLTGEAAAEQSRVDAIVDRLAGTVPDAEIRLALLESARRSRAAGAAA